MIDVNSNCSRVDAVKAMATQLRMQATQVPHQMPEDTAYRKVQTKLDALDVEVKKGDAQKAETALSTAKNMVNQISAAATGSSSSSRSFDAYA